MFKPFSLTPWRGGGRGVKPVADIPLTLDWEDTHKKCFFSGRITKAVGRLIINIRVMLL